MRFDYGEFLEVGYEKISGIWVGLWYGENVLEIICFVRGMCVYVVVGRYNRYAF